MERKTNKQKLEEHTYRLCDSFDIVEDDIVSLQEGHAITKIQISKDIRKLKDNIRYLENLLKTY